MSVWCNGAFVDHLTLDLAERGLMLGDGIFETIAVREGRAIWLDAHLARMARTADALGLAFDEHKLRGALFSVLIKSAAPSEVLRITLTRGPTGRGFAINGDKPTLMISLNPFDLSKLPASVRLATSTIRRNPSAPSSHFKTISYIDGIAAAREVAGRADDALLLNTEGHVACTTIANVFLLKDATLITPSDGQGILPGIARAVIMAGVAELGLSLELRPVQSAELATADAVFVTNSLRLATPVSSIDGKACGMRAIDDINAFLERDFS
ncbi:aminotransferase class IV [Aestuariivirga litoralis]|uniref:aminotransferase class IV n=1 Tax=Aestuariivirga litoralis TaxID=2650924 RepID=UPI0018C66670|nr:aminotransferase class IV [Aestuariivirga litoralis]MBG1233621.1 class IV aminotransferase [Aestuariivirga litoralis]